MYADKDGLEKYKPVPGTNFNYRIDNPVQPNQQVHAHIYDKQGNQLTVLNKDGTGSHGSCPKTELPRNKLLKRFLISRGFQLGFNAAAAEVITAGYIGWSIGSALNEAIEAEYGTNAGLVLYEMIHE
jgi:hypothetical protein